MAIRAVGIDIIGPFPKAPGYYAYVVVAVDYFTKWVETSPEKHNRSCCSKILLEERVVSLRPARVVISDNGRQFADNPFKAWCENLGIKQHFTSVGHPQANGQVENFNRTLHGLKTRLHRAGSSWMEELPVCSGPTELRRGQQPKKPRFP
nr:uncharacterized protein K02A2.6-like [Coffea arabica]